MVMGQDYVDQDTLFAEPLEDDYKIKIVVGETEILSVSSYKVDNVVDQREDRNILNWDKLLSESNSRNEVYNFYHSDLIHVDYHFLDFRFGVGVSLGSETFVSVPKSSIDLLVNGNDDFLGEEVFLGLNGRHSSWHDLHLDIGYRWKGFNPWVRFSIIDGYQNTHVSGGYNIFSSASNDVIEFDRELSVYSSNMLTYYEFDSLDFEFHAPIVNALQSSSRINWKINFGVDYQNGDHSIKASISDINQFEWEGRNYNASGEVSYSGIDLSESLNGDFDVDFRDTLNNIIGVQEFEEIEYESKISTKLKLDYNYQFLERYSASLFGAYHFVEDFNYYYIGVKGGIDISKKFRVDLSYVLDKYSYDNIGLHTSVVLDHFDFHLGFKNMAAIFTPYDFRLIGVDFGFAFKI